MKDPVCLKDVDEHEAQANGLTSERDGQMQYFCSQECKDRYDEHPLDYGMRSSDFQHPDNIVDR
jgi:YHS domain-containing protein